MTDKPFAINKLMDSHLPTLLFKYRSLSPQNNQKIYTYNLLTKGEIYFAKLDELNDPEDFFFELNKADYHLLSPFEAAKYPGQKITQNSDGTGIYLLDVGIRTKRIRDVLNKAERGIFSITGRNNNPKMFEHYTENGNGICIGFAWEEMDLWYHGSFPPQKQVPKKVTYLEEPLKISERPEEYIEAFAAKHSKWAYEEEWRFFHKHGCYATKEVRRAIKQIVFGVNIAAKDKAMVKESVKDLDILFFQVIPEIVEGNMKLIPLNS